LIFFDENLLVCKRVFLEIIFLIDELHSDFGYVAEAIEEVINHGFFYKFNFE
jgi:hypothetical protein